MKYLLDSNIYMDCYDRYYLHEYFPTFWRQFTPLINQFVVATDVMLDEHQHDEWFIEWFRKNYHGSILNHVEYAEEWSNVLEHVRICGKYRSDALAGDKGWAHERIADPWLIAIAKHDGYTLVTSEQRDVNMHVKGHIAKAAKIPDVADALGVQVIDRNKFFGIVALSV
mgnify:FL=1